MGADIYIAENLGFFLQHRMAAESPISQFSAMQRRSASMTLNSAVCSQAPETSRMGGFDLTTRNPVIRPAQATDANALASCIDAAYAQYAERISDMPSVSDGCAEDIANNQVWVAVQGDEVIAGLVLVVGDRFMKLANLAVHPDHVGKGLGRNLIALSEHEAKRQGFGEMRLNTHVDMPENVRLYQHLGWAEVSRSGSTVSMKKQLIDG